jgi:putative peptidoglycan lipid II flippase
VRQRIFNHYFGQYDVGDAFNQAIKIPNFLQNLFGEGVLSASFIPVYSRLLAEGDDEEAGRVGGAVGAILALTTSLLVLAGILAAPFLFVAIAPGFEGEKRELTIRIVRILFPGVGLMVISAWCLGILNSHRKFLLSYAAPVAWNAAMIATMVGFGRLEQTTLVIKLAWASVAGSALMLGVQMPVVLRLARRLRPSISAKSAHVRVVIKNFFPVFTSRGVVQISAYVDSLIASLLGTGAASGLVNAQLVYLLPVSLFGMSVSAAELPAMSSALGEENEIAAYLRRRLNSGLRQIAFFIVPSAMAFLALGDVITGTLFQTGRFVRADSVYLWGILAGSAVGLLASTMGRLYASTYYALRDTRTPLRFAVVRVALTAGLGFLFAIPLPHLIGLEPRWGVAGLTASAGMAGWIEFTLLRRSLNRRIGVTGLHSSLVVKLWAAAAVSAGVGWAVKSLIGVQHPIMTGIAVLAPYGITYFAATYAMGVEECAGTVKRLLHARA